MSNPVLHFDLQAEDSEKLAKFYNKVFDWKIEKVEAPMEYWFIETVPMDEKMAPFKPGINGGIGKRQTPDQRLMNYIDVKSIDDAVKKIEKAGGKIIMPKTEMPGVGELAVAEDIEGNPFGLWSIPE
jgi:predicted enzyme related to lactoylglutathione lyase